jgi:hypothetical protein
MPTTLTKGDRVRVRRFVTIPLASLAGVQAKASGEMQEFDGEVTRIGADSLTIPQTIGICVKRDDGSTAVVRPGDVVAILAAKEGR